MNLIIETEFKATIGEPASLLLDHWVTEFNAELILTPERLSVHGNCRFLSHSRSSKITVNKSANIYRMLITLVHEIAHAKTFLEFGMLNRPHGQQWKDNYINLMNELKVLKIFPYDLEIAIERHFRNPKFTDCVDPAFSRILKQYDS